MLVWMVLLTSGIVDEEPTRSVWGSVQPACWSGTSPSSMWSGVLARCWALRNHILCPGAPVGVVGLPPSSETHVSVWWVLVGVVVDSWIVDASIL